MADEKQMCFGCSTQPAVTGGPVPLCSRCSALAKKNKRGVKFESRHIEPSLVKPDDPPERHA